MPHHTQYPAIYEVWDHSHLDPDKLVPPDRLGGPLLSYGYWIMEVGEPTKVTGAYFHRRAFRWERREGPSLSVAEAYEEQYAPSPVIDFEDFPDLLFDKDPFVLRELQRTRDVELGYRTPSSVEASADQPLRAQIESVAAAVDEFLSEEIWSLKYVVTEEYCLYLRRRRGLRRLWPW